MKYFMAAFFYVSLCINGIAQDTSISFENRVFTMPAAVIRTNLDVPAFIKYVKRDTSFYKAFKNIKVLGFTSINDIKMRNKKEEIIASLNSKTKQNRKDGCRKTTIIEETTTGNFYNDKKNYNYYTAEMYASIMFANELTCGEDNIVGDGEISTKGMSGLEKHKQQLKMLFFNPGKKIKGIPLMGKKTAIFDDALTAYYDNQIDYETYNGAFCYKFIVTAKKDLTKAQRGNIVIDEMVTWFRSDDFKIMGRNYLLSYNAGVYDFKVDMQIQMTTYKNLVVPALIRYVGNWNVAFKKRERGIFTATLFDFTD
jgi:hypothetical protein